MSVVGIDLGTTNTVVACVRSGRVHVIADEDGHRLLPSVVSFHPNGEVLIGATAKERRGIDGRNTISSVKRLIGRSWHSEELTKARERFAFEMREGPGQGPLVVARNQEYTLPEISAFILKKARHIAEAALNEPVERAVITVPAHFNELQRASTKVAGRVSGVEVLRILNEPTAAALAYGLGRSNNERIAVYDFGGGTFDCTLLDLSGNVFEVLATAGDTFLGGDDIDTLIADRMADTFLRQFRYDPRSDPQAFERLRLAAEQVKIDLSVNEQTQIVLREIAYGVGGASLDLTFSMTRGDIEALTEPLVERSFKVTQDALSLARLTPTSFDHVILVGGCTRMPLVRGRVEGFFGLPPLDRVNPDEVVAIGAAIQAAALSDQLRRRSIPAPPQVAKKVQTQRGISELPAQLLPQRPRLPAQDDPNTMSLTVDAPSIRTVPGVVPGNAPNSAIITNRMDQGPSNDDNTIPTLDGPKSRTLPLNPPMSASAPSQPNTLVRGPGGPESRAAPPAARQSTAPMRSPTVPPQRPSTAPMPRPSAPPNAAPQTPLPPVFGYDLPDNTASSFPDLKDLPRPHASHDANAKPLPPLVRHSTPSRGFNAFGAIEEMPSIQSTTGAAAEAHAASGLPSPIGYERQQTLQQQQQRQQSPQKASTMLGRPMMPAQQQQAPIPPPPVPSAPQPQQRYASHAPPPYQPPQYQPPQYPPPPYQPPQQQHYAPPQYRQPAYAPSAPPNPYDATQLPRFDDPHEMPAIPSPERMISPMGGYSMPPGVGMGPGAPILVDVTPRALVVETVGGYCDTVIPRNAKIPCERTRQFTTGSDHQTLVRVRVAQGEHQQFLHNTYLGEVELSGIRPGIRGEVKVGVTFELDADGSVRVRAADLSTGQEAIATLQLVGLLTDEPSIISMIDRMANQPIGKDIV